MAEGLVWLALLGVFIALARSGWIEYRKVEAYRLWAQSYERAKYDIYAVLGQKEQTLTWGKPTLAGPAHLCSTSFDDISQVLVRVDGQSVDYRNPPSRGKNIVLELQHKEDGTSAQIPFTDVTLAVQWAEYLAKALQNVPASASQASEV
ncbi:hypothetical protein [Acaryochloris sp. IP29b_bin.148]|uniref:hypothetical protein n=1 Tax=Acaryochloris sp. IP29b_bin.148 TaxID=2969218 RepID=UPI00262D1D8B|nr:hypothetical protein [Acaryochloris sp. IP29b_bin.148]